MKPWRRQFGIWVPDRSLSDERGFITAGTVGTVAGARRRGAASEQPLITSGAGSSLRNNYTGYVGFTFVAASALVVTALGRWIVSGNSNSHQIVLYNKTTSTEILRCTLNASGKTAGAFAWETTSTSGSSLPYTLTSGDRYNVVSEETSGQDQWYEAFTVTYTSAATSLANCLGTNGNPGTANLAWVPTNIKYQ